MLAPLLLLWPMSIAITYLVAKSIANEPVRPRARRPTSPCSRADPAESTAVAELRLPDAARDFLRADDVDSVFFQVLGTRGELRRRRPRPAAAARRDRAAAGHRSQFRDDMLRGNDMRVAYA